MITTKNNFRIYEVNEINGIKKLEEENLNVYLGFFYILEWDGIVKIGSTKHPFQRFNALKHTAEKYGDSKVGRIAFSKPHTNYLKNENYLHTFFKSHRKIGSELFEISFDEVLGSIPVDIEYLDESKKMEAKAESFFQQMAEFILNGSNTIDSNNNYRTFIHDEYGILRVINIKDNLWFALEDIERVLGDLYIDLKLIFAYIIDPDISTLEMVASADTAEKQYVNIINESGLFTLLSLAISETTLSIKENNQELLLVMAKKIIGFKKWIIQEVIPDAYTYKINNKYKELEENARLLAKAILIAEEGLKEQGKSINDL